MSKGAIARRFLRRSTPDLSELRSRALALEADGRIRDAISAWSALNRIETDAWIETHLVDLRCDPNNLDTDHHVHNQRDKRLEHWPRALPDPFPDVFGRPPEIAAHELSMKLLGGAILHHGSLLVRGLIPPERAKALRATIDRAFDGREANLVGAPASATTPWFVPCAPWDAIEAAKAKAIRKLDDECKAVHAADSPRALFQVIDALESTNVIEVIAQYLGERPHLSIHKTMLRRVPPDARPSFHQDGAFMGTETRAVDIWVALSDCGEGNDAPGLAILPKRLDSSILPEGATAEWPLSPSVVEEASAEVPFVSPMCAPGDALLFDELLLHANGGGRPGLTRHRYALEAWMFAPSSMPGAYLPMLA